MSFGLPLQLLAVCAAAVDDRCSNTGQCSDVEDIASEGVTADSPLFQWDPIKVSYA